MTDEEAYLLGSQAQSSYCGMKKTGVLNLLSCSIIEDLWDIGFTRTLNSVLDKHLKICRTLQKLGLERSNFCKKKLDV